MFIERIKPLMTTCRWISIPENSHILWRTVNEMNRLDLDTQILIQEINESGNSVYPHLANI